MNNPLRFNDPSGEFIPLLIIGGIALAGAINVAVNWDNIDNIGQGFAYFGVGAIGGFFMIKGNVVGGGAFIAAGNSILTQGFDNGFNNVNFGQVSMSDVIGGGTAYLGGGIAQKLQGPLSSAFSSVGSPMLREGLTYGTNGALTGFTLGTGMGLAGGQSFEDALVTGGKSAGLGFASGFGYGSYSGYQYARQHHLDPFTGRWNGKVENPAFRTTPNNLTEQLSLKEAMSGKGYRAMDETGDPRWSGWDKMEHVHRRDILSTSISNGKTIYYWKEVKTTIHYWRNPKTGDVSGFKFK